MGTMIPTPFLAECYACVPICFSGAVYWMALRKSRQEGNVQTNITTEGFPHPFQNVQSNSQPVAQAEAQLEEEGIVIHVGRPKTTEETRKMQAEKDAAMRQAEVECDGKAVEDAN